MSFYKQMLAPSQDLHSRTNLDVTLLGVPDHAQPCAGVDLSRLDLNLACCSDWSL